MLSSVKEIKISKKLYLFIKYNFSFIKKINQKQRKCLKFTFTCGSVYFFLLSLYFFFLCFKRSFYFILLSILFKLTFFITFYFSFITLPLLSNFLAVNRFLNLLKIKINTPYLFNNSNLLLLLSFFFIIFLVIIPPLLS